MSGYYLSAEPVGVCSCHACTCPGCVECDPPEDDWARAEARRTGACPWDLDRP